MRYPKGYLMNRSRIPLPSAALGDSTPKIPFRKFLLGAHVLRTIWGSVLVVGLIWYWVVNLVNAPPQPCGKTPDYSIVVGHLVPLTLFTIPYIIHVALQFRAYMQCRKGAKLQSVRWINIYSILVAPIMSVMLFAVTFPMDRESSPVLYDTILSIVFFGEILISIIVVIVVSKSLKLLKR